MDKICSYCGYLEPQHEEKCLNQVTELDLKKLYDVIYNCQQVMAGYSQDDTWSDYDREAHAALIQMQFTVLRQLESTPTPNRGAEEITNHDLLLKANKWVENSHYPDANATSFAAGYTQAMSEYANQVQQGSDTNELE